MELPDWGFHQLEVCTDKSIKQTSTIWNVEEHQQNITYRKFSVIGTDGCVFDYRRSACLEEIA